MIQPQSLKKFNLKKISSLKKICGPGKDFGLKKGPKNNLGQKISSRKTNGQKIFGLKKMQLVEKNSTATIFSIQKRFGPEKKWDTTKLCSKTCCGQKKFA